MGIPGRVRINGYTRAGTGKRVRAQVRVNWAGMGITGGGYGRAGTGIIRTGYAQVFYRKTRSGPFNTRTYHTRLPAYTRARVRVPRATDTGCPSRVLSKHYM